uniref:Uncharacterized protein n=1 Tax=Rangifer tarandus platyrhynchus TaxID=3082113 RepID=A0ACB0DXH8_RANTA|nr:unnamed protein product [Rangifer tarandus platyrhynchus]
MSPSFAPLLRKFGRWSVGARNSSLPVPLPSRSALIFSSSRHPPFPGSSSAKGARCAEAGCSVRPRAGGSEWLGRVPGLQVDAGPPEREAARTRVREDAGQFR